MPQMRPVWHYGLMAEYWANFKHEAPELPGLLGLLCRSGQPVLDLACGTGRVLFGLLRAGVDVDGIDVSPDMIAYANITATRERHAAKLSVQPMDNFSTHRKYGSIVIVDSFGLGGDRDADRRTLRCVRAALQPGGALIMNTQAEYTEPEAWRLWTEEFRSRLPEDWPESAIERVAANGDVYRLSIRTIAASPIRQTYEREMRIEKLHGGKRLGVETAKLHGNMYLPCEVTALLREAGFGYVELLDGFTGVPATDESRNVVYFAQAASAA